MKFEKNTDRIPHLSIITAVLNAKEDLAKSIKSIRKQHFKDFELIVIDGGSTDGTREVIRQNEDIIHFWLSEPDKGIYHAMNKGLSRAKGEFVTFLNAGDAYCNEEVLESIFADTNGCDIIYGDIVIVFDDQKPDYYMKAMEFSKHKLLEAGTRVVCHQAFFVKRALAPTYDTSYKYKAELSWYFDILEKNPSLEIMHKSMEVVYYPLNGYGHVNYLSNLLEWCKLIITRFGFRTFFKYKYPKLIVEKLKTRYPKYFTWLHQP